MVAHLSRAAGAMPIAFQLLIDPATDRKLATRSHRTSSQGYLLTNDTIADFQQLHIRDPAHLLDPRAAPLLHNALCGSPSRT